MKHATSGSESGGVDRRSALRPLLTWPEPAVPPGRYRRPAGRACWSRRQSVCKETVCCLVISHAVIDFPRMT